LMNVSKMKSCSVPQIGDAWEWKQFNKVASARRTATAQPEPSSPAAPAPA
jgi:hypothetical protein